MQAKVYLNQPLTQDRYGLHFEKGEALCDNEYIINKLQKKGVKVEVIEEEKAPADKTLEEMTVAELKAIAAEKGIEIPNGSKKADIIELLNNIDATKEVEPKNPDTNPEDPDSKPDSVDSKPDTNPEINTPDGEENPKTEPTEE